MFVRTFQLIPCRFSKGRLEIILVRNLCNIAKDVHQRNWQLHRWKEDWGYFSSIVTHNVCSSGIMPIPSVTCTILWSGKRSCPRAYIFMSSVTVVTLWLNEFQSRSIHKDQGVNVLITQVLDHTVVPETIRLARQVRKMRAQEYSTIEHRFQDATNHLPSRYQHWRTWHSLRMVSCLCNVLWENALPCKMTIHQYMQGAVEETETYKVPPPVKFKCRDRYRSVIHAFLVRAAVPFDLIILHVII